MHRSRTRAVGLAAATLPLAFLAGCGEDDPVPKFEDPTSSAASPSESPSPEEPVKPTPPAAMEGDDVKAAEAFAEYYFDLLGYAKFSGHTEQARRLALPTCAACDGAMDGVEATYDAGGQYKGGEMNVIQAKMSPLGEVRGVQTFRGTLIIRTTREVVSGTGNDKLDRVYGASRVKLEFVSMRDGKGWHVSEWQQI